MSVTIIDIESNELYPYQDTTWTICLRRVGGESLTLNPFRSTPHEVKEQILDFVFCDPSDDPPVIVGHNYLGFDGWVLWKDFGIEMSVGKDTMCGRPVIYFDTLYASQFLLPDRFDGHSLRSWGIRLGDKKIDYYDLLIQNGVLEKGAPPEAAFYQWTPWMDEYCLQDTKVTEQVYLQLSKQIEEEESWQAFRLGQKTFWLMAAQAFTGFRFDIEKAEKLKVRIEQMIADLAAEVEPQLPPRPLKKTEMDFYQMPVKPWLKDCTKFSANMEKFIEKHNAKVISLTQIEVYGKVVEVMPDALVLDSAPMLLSDQNAIKDFFLSQSWEPTLWNYKLGPDKRPMRDEKGQLIKTSPKMQEAGKICENLLELDGELPKKIVRFMSLRNRHSILEGWLSHPRLEWDGRLPAGSSGLANSHRQKHVTIVNVPKAQDDVLLGKEFRELFTVEEGFKLVGCDQAALEARCEAHWVYDQIDGIERANILISGDLHSSNAKILFPEETKEFDISSPDFTKDAPGFKKFRQLAKSFAYASAYGASPAKLAKTIGRPEREGKRLFDTYWLANRSLKAFKDKLEWQWERKGKKMWIETIDGRRLYSRAKHSLVNLCFQSTGAIIVDYALCLFDARMGGLKIDQWGRPYYTFKDEIVKRVQYTHDEFGCEVEEEIAEEIGAIMEWCMVESGVRLKINVPLVGESKIGLSWKETH